VTGLLVRWLGGALLALLVSVAGLELSVCLADERERAVAHASGAGLMSTVLDAGLLPVGVELDDADPSLMPWLTR
jgi:hypothetical protein